MPKTKCKEVPKEVCNDVIKEVEEEQVKQVCAPVKVKSCLPRPQKVARQVVHRLPRRHCQPLGSGGNEGGPGKGYQLVGVFGGCNGYPCNKG